MKNYVVIDGERYDFVNVSKKADDACNVCDLRNFCQYEDTPCSVFNSASGVSCGDTHAFAKHVVKSKKQ